MFLTTLCPLTKLFEHRFSKPQNVLIAIKFAERNYFGQFCIQYTYFLQFVANTKMQLKPNKSAAILNDLSDRPKISIKILLRAYIRCEIILSFKKIESAILEV